MYCLLQIHRHNTRNMATAEVGIVSGVTAYAALPKTAQQWRRYLPLSPPPLMENLATPVSGSSTNCFIWAPLIAKFVPKFKMCVNCVVNPNDLEKLLTKKVHPCGAPRSQVKFLVISRAWTLNTLHASIGAN